jgi:hypothetical protein
VIETQSMPQTGEWPKLTLDEWAPTQTTLHRWTQIVGKTRLALAPMQNHWWQVVLYVTERGLTTSPIPYDRRTFDVNFDFNDHVLIARTSDGDSDVMELPGLSVGDFYSRYMAMLRSLGIEIRIMPVPMELMDTTSFVDDRIHASYDPDAVRRCCNPIVSSGDFAGASSENRALRTSGGVVSISRARDSRDGPRRCTPAEFQTARIG